MKKLLSKAGERSRIKVELAYAIFTITLYILILHSFFFNQDIYSWGTDIYGHLYKVWKVMNHGYIEWTKDWYAGTPLFRFYPPLSYLIAAGFGKIFNSDVIGFKITTLLAMMIGAYGTRFLLIELRIGRKLAYFISLLYPIYPFFINNVIPEGNFPRYVALMLLPLFVLAFLHIFKYKDTEKLFLSSLFIAFMILTHHTTAFVSVFLIILLLPYLFISKQLSLKEVLRNMTIVFSLSFLIVSFWIIPFILELKYSEFIDELEIIEQYKMWSVDLKRILDREYACFFGPLFFIVGTLGYIFTFFSKDLEKKVLSLNSLVAISIFILLASGIYGPFPKLNQTFPLSRVHPYRFLDSLGILVIIGTAKLLDYLFNIMKNNNRRNKKIIVVISFLLSMVILDILFVTPKLSLPYISEWVKEDIVPKYLETLEFISTNISLLSENVHQYLTEVEIGSMMAYYPAKFGILSSVGWYRQGHYKVSIRSISLNSVLSLQSLSDYAFGSIESLLITQNIKCIIVNKWVNSEYVNVLKNLELLEFKKVQENEQYSVWCWNRNSFIAPKHYQLIREYKIGRLFALVGNPLITRYFNISVDHYKSLDDLAYHENIFAYKVIFLYDYGDYVEQTVWSKLEEFVRRGGVLVIDTFRSRDMYSKVFNVTSHVHKIEKKNLYSEIYDVTRFDEFSRNFDWYATVYSGDLKPIIKYVVRDRVKYEEYVAVGYKVIGYGYVFFIGLNLPNHIEYTGNEYEKFVLQDILERFIPLFPNILEYRVLEYRDGRIRAIVNSKYDTWVLIAQSYFPGWRARLNGVEIPVYEDSEYGLIELFIPEGTWILELEFVDKWLWLKYVSLFTFAAVVATLLYPTTRRLLSCVFTAIRMTTRRCSKGG